MSAAYVSQRDGGAPTQLDTKATPPVSVTEGDAAEPRWLARVLTRVLADIAEIRRRFAPNRITFRDIAVTGTGAGASRHSLTHNFGQLVEWWPVRVINPGPDVEDIAEVSQDGNVLVLDVFFTGTLWIRCEGAG